MKFDYQARDKSGKLQTGIIEAPSKESALRFLERSDVYVTFLRESKDIPFYAKSIELFSKISTRDVVLFTRQLAIMFTARVSLIEILQTISEQMENKNFKGKILKMSEEVEGGSSFSQVLSKYPDVFSSFYISMIKSGETSGQLVKALEHLAEHLERQYHLIGKIKSAMIYPTFVLVTSFSVAFLMAFFVMPNITKVIQETGQDLPLVTKVIITFFDFIRAWGWVFIILLIGAGIVLFQYIKTKDGRMIFHKIILEIPIINSFLRTIYLARFAENLATLVAGGIPIATSLTITGEIVGNEVYKAIIMKARVGVQKGEQISSTLQRYPKYFPPVFTEMIRAGEKSGALDNTLLNISAFYQKEVDRSIDSFLSLLEPIMIVGLGVFVGGVMAAVLLPLYQLSAL